MRKRLHKTLLFLAMTLGVPACIDPFNPPEINNPENYLVFDGYINANGTDTSRVRLSRTLNIHDNYQIQYEPGAEVQVEGENGQIYPLVRDLNTPGDYYLTPQQFNIQQRYRVRIDLRQKIYESEWQRFTISPPIDSVTYQRRDRDGVQVYVHTHDDTDNSRFYKWTFDETWEYGVPLYSALELVDDEVVDRMVAVDRCWTGGVATNINIFTSATLSRDLVRYHPVTYVAANTGKLLRGYSILVHQQVLTREAYDYWAELSKNNETNGSIFDPFPSQLTGNIRSVSDPDEKVFGFFGGGVVESQRIFIREYLGIAPQCPGTDTLTLSELRESSDLIAHELPEGPGNYVTASASCLDCRVFGGTIVRPDFWR